MKNFQPFPTFKQLISAMLILVSSSIYAESPAGADAADYLCSQIDGAADVDPGRFSESFIGTLTPSGDLSDFKAAANGLFDEIYRKAGSCIAAERYGQFQPDAMNQLLLIMEDDSRLGTLLQESPGGKIEAFLHFSNLEPENFLSTQEFQVTMRDGTHLRTIVYQGSSQNEPSNQPVVLVRTPYFKMWDNFLYIQHRATAEYFVKLGYVFVMQSMRGMHGSEGTAKFFDPQEPEDAYDTITWVTQQEFSNGRVATIGTSYEGYGAVTAGILNPPGLEVIISGAGPTDGSNGVFSFEGLTSLALLEYLYYLETGKGFPYGALFGPGSSRESMARIEGNLDLRQYDEIFYGSTVNEWDLFVAALTDPTHEYWSSRSHLDSLKNIQIPTYHIAGTKLDGDLVDTIYNYLSVNDSPNQAYHHLILGHWDHGGNTPVGNGDNVSQVMRERIEAILSYYLKDETSQAIVKDRVTISPDDGTTNYVGDSFPPADFGAMDLWFDRAGGESILNESPAYDQSVTSYINDPLSLDPENQSVDVTWTNKSEVAVHLLGPVTLKLFLEVDAVASSTLFSLSKVNSEGQIQFLTTCNIGFRLSDSITYHDKTFCSLNSLIQPGEQICITLTSNFFAQEEPAAVTRHPNVGPEDFFTRSTRAEISLHHSRRYPSAVRFTLAPQSSAAVPTN